MGVGNQSVSSPFVELFTILWVRVQFHYSNEMLRNCLISPSVADHVQAICLKLQIFASLKESDFPVQKLLPFGLLQEKCNCISTGSNIWSSSHRRVVCSLIWSVGGLFRWYGNYIGRLTIKNVLIQLLFQRIAITHF